MKFPSFILCLLVLCCSTVSADQIIQEGSLAGGEGINEHKIFLDRFDELNGSHQLNFVQLDFLTSLIGGGQSNGTGVPTQVFAQLRADYFFDAKLLADTEALIDTVILNNGPPGSFTVFDSSTAQLTIDQADDLTVWIGSDQLTLAAITEFMIDEDPASSVGFGAGGTVRYTVTYDFTILLTLGDVNLDGVVDLLDVAPFVALLNAGGYQAEADVNQDGVFDLLDVAPFVELLSGA